MLNQLEKSFQQAGKELAKEMAKINLRDEIGQERQNIFFSNHDEEHLKVSSSYQLQWKDGMDESLKDYAFFSNQLDSAEKSVYSQFNETTNKSSDLMNNRKNMLFERNRQDQKKSLNSLRKKVYSKYRSESINIDTKNETFTLKNNERKDTLTITRNDFQKLEPETDLNDTIMENYLKILMNKVFKPELASRVMIFSTFFMQRLLGTEMLNQKNLVKTKEEVLVLVRQKIQTNYSFVQKWTKKDDIFTKDFLVFPINSFKHWNCIIVVYPKSLMGSHEEDCRLIYLDSLQHRKQMLTETIKLYLKQQLQEKKNINNQYCQSIPVYQLLIPRQTNCHDCGLFTLTYIEIFLQNEDKLKADMRDTRNRQHLRMFPRSLILTMRNELRLLFYGLLVENDKDKVIKQYMDRRYQMIDSGYFIELDRINDRQFRKFCELSSREVLKTPQSEFHWKLKFYFDYSANYIEINNNYSR